MVEISEELLQGKTLRIYWFLLEHPNTGIREMDRQLAFNSPSTVLYHVNKLFDAGLVRKVQDKYYIVEPINKGIFSLYLKIGSRMIPRIVFYLSFLIAACILYFCIVLTRSPTIVYFEDLFTILIILLCIFFFAFEAFCIWKMKPT
ncbi:hypothetical protein [Candidatus Hodarchaeum mangrovi]